MFETMVLVCLVTNPSFCYTLADLYGPYYTKKECINRAYIIARDLSFARRTNKLHHKIRLISQICSVEGTRESA